MSDPIVASARAAISGLREAIAVGKEADQLAADISALGKAEVQARSAFRQRQRVVQGDTTIIAAMQEYERLKEIKDLENSLRDQVIREQGKEAWEAILAIKNRKIKEALEERDEFGRDLRKLRQLKWFSFGFGLVCTLLLWLFGLL